MCAELAESRAWATIWKPVPAAILTQKLVELSARGDGSAFTATWNCCGAFESSSPKPPVCAAVGRTVAEPFPRRPSQASREPLSNPSANTCVVYELGGPVAE